jgi:hypothetical protein
VHPSPGTALTEHGMRLRQGVMHCARINPSPHVLTGDNNLSKSAVSPETDNKLFGFYQMKSARLGGFLRTR